jgi:hypothetical protein
MSDKRQVFVTLHCRDEASLGENRQRFGYAAYHWGILISPKFSTGRDCCAYDVTNAAHPDPVTRVDFNPDRNWFFRATTNVNPMASTRLLGRVMIGKVPCATGYLDVENLLRSIPLPEKDAIPEQNCVTWVMAVIQKLQYVNIAQQFDLNKFMDYALEYADQRIGDPGTTANTVNYTDRKM